VTTTEPLAADPEAVVETPVDRVTLARRSARGPVQDHAGIPARDRVEARAPVTEEEVESATTPASIVPALVMVAVHTMPPPIAPAPIDLVSDRAPLASPPPAPFAPVPGVPGDSGVETAARALRAPTGITYAGVTPVEVDATATTAPPAPVSPEAAASPEAPTPAVPLTVAEPRPRPAPVARGGEALHRPGIVPPLETEGDDVIERPSAGLPARVTRVAPGRDPLPEGHASASRDADGAAPAPASDVAIGGATAPAASTTPRAAGDVVESPRPGPARDPVDQVVTRLREVKGPGRHEISLRLDPPDLGSVRIDARLEGARLHVQIRAEHAQTGERLSDALPRLRESLAQQGFVPGEVSVHLGLDASGSDAGHRSARDGAPTFMPPLDGEAAPRPRVIPAAARAVAVSDGLDVWA